jgi:Holliday junction resolvase RusA-like endonuclease
MPPDPLASRDDRSNGWQIQVRGYPPRVKGIGWREAIRDQVRATYPQAPFAKPSETKFEVEVIFRMTAQDMDKPALDLDNLIKPVLDTLFTSQNVSSPVTKVLFPVNDTWVFRLALAKIRVETPEDQGADITVTSHPPGTPDLGTAASPSA